MFKVKQGRLKSKGKVSLSDQGQVEGVEHEISIVKYPAGFNRI